MAVLNAGILKSLCIPLPSFAEQEAIAEALSDMDALIESLEQLITKKRLIKQGVMQDLLTGKKRLPGFSGEWEVKKLGEVSTVIMGQSPDSKFYNSQGVGIPLIQGNADIQNRKSIQRVWTTQITKLCGEGKTILFYSSDDEELVGLCDRVLVLHDGVIRSELTGSSLTKENLIAASLGVSSSGGEA